MIVRVWQGVAPQSKISDFVNYVQQELLHSYLKVPGNRGALLLSRPRADHTELLLLSFWESASSLEDLTGPEVVRALTRELINPSPILKNYEVIEYHAPEEGHEC